MTVRCTGIFYFEGSFYRNLKLQYINIHTFEHNPIFLNTFRINGHIITYYNTGYYVSNVACRDYCDHNSKCDTCVISTGYASKDEIKSF